MGSYPLVFNSQFNHLPPFSHAPFCVQLYPFLLIPCGNTLRLFTNQNIRKTHSYHRYKFLQTKIPSKFMYLFSPPSESSLVPRASFLIFNPMPPLSDRLTHCQPVTTEDHTIIFLAGWVVPPLLSLSSEHHVLVILIFISCHLSLMHRLHLEMPYSSC